jgi:hypothetical protein
VYRYREVYRELLSGNVLSRYVRAGFKFLRKHIREKIWWVFSGTLYITSRNEFSKKEDIESESEETDFFPACMPDAGVEFSVIRTGVCGFRRNGRTGGLLSSDDRKRAGYTEVYSRNRQ